MRPLNALLEFTKGFFITMLLLAAISFVVATWYASEIDMGGNPINWTADYGDQGNAGQLLYKSWFDTNYTYSLVCEYISISNSNCNSGNCYANKPTAQKVCQDNGYDFVSGWGYELNGDISANAWTGSAWLSFAATDTYAPAPIDGGSIGPSPGGFCGAGCDTNRLSRAYCCGEYIPK